MSTLLHPHPRLGLTCHSPPSALWPALVLPVTAAKSTQIPWLPEKLFAPLPSCASERFPSWLSAKCPWVAFWFSHYRTCSFPPCQKVSFARCRGLAYPPAGCRLLVQAGSECLPKVDSHLRGDGACPHSAPRSQRDETQEKTDRVKMESSFESFMKKQTIKKVCPVSDLEKQTPCSWEEFRRTF